MFSVFAVIIATFLHAGSWSPLSLWFLLVVYTHLIFVVTDVDEETYKS
jgi:hypothetical protein